MIARLLTALALLGLVSRAAAQDDLKGTWVIQKAVQSGKTLDDAKARGAKLVITADRMTAYDPDNKELYVMGYKANPSVTPKTIDMRILKGKDLDRTASGIYALEGDTLKLAYSLDESKRPKELSSKEGDEVMLIEMKRAKD